MADKGDEDNGTWRNENLQLDKARLRSQYASKNKKNAEEMREMLMDYFNGTGSVPWQDRMIEINPQGQAVP
jgi:hypothetical protein